MITGQVLNRQALLPIPFRLPNRPNLTIQFVIDTGFTDFLTLPATAVNALGLSFLHLTFADLADGSTVSLAVHTATIVWNGVEREVLVLAPGRRPLLGTSLLDGYQLNIQFTHGGQVIVATF